MTLEQLMQWNHKIPFQEYEAALKQIDSKKRALRKANDVIYDELDSLDILADEKGSERWQKHEKRRAAAVKRVKRLEQEIATLEREIKGE